MNDDQPSQPLTGYELDNIEGRWSRYVALRDPDSMETSVHDVPDLLAEVDRLRSALTALGRNEQAAVTRSLELQEENERLRLEVVQMESGAQIAMNAGVVALQEVKRLEIERDDLKIINDRMAEDRLRLVDERDSILTDLLQYSQLHWEDCPLDEEDCYLCEGSRRIRDRWKGVE